MTTETWRNCGVCKRPIFLNQTYQKCSISSCKKHVFCCVNCWSVHDSVMGHKSSYAEENTAPDSLQDKPRRRIIASSSSSKSNQSNSDLPQDVLIVISKLKNYAKAKADVNTSSDVGEELSKYVRLLVDMALEQTSAEGRKTLMARDFKNIRIEN